MREDAGNLPFVSVIIPTYNYAIFLVKAIESVLSQSYKNFEIIVIDDGSTDNTNEVVNNMHGISYFYQQNKGLAAARNAGIEHAKGDFLVFLDADDWLEKQALEWNLAEIQKHPDIAFVSGNYYLQRAEENRTEQVAAVVEKHHYMRLLQSNYIGMHAAVMFRRWVFEEVRYDEQLQACEDYDLYLAIARNYPVVHHSKFIATYYFHACGLSHNYPLMIESITAVIKKQLPFLCNEAQLKAYEEGMKQWRCYYDLMQSNV